MQKPATPANEKQRLEELESYGVLDTLPEQAYDDIVLLAAQICDTPIALVSLVDEERQWFKARFGLDATETARDLAFCAHAINEPEELLVVRDATLDERFHDNPLVIDDPAVRFYAGAPLVTSQGSALGTLCVIDRQARQLDTEQENALKALARQVIAQLELRVAIDELEAVAEERRRYHQQLEEYQRQLEERHAVVTEQSLTDVLTGLRNRRAFRIRLKEELARARRYGRPLSLAMIDVDEFKAFNDTHGHQAGDDALREIAGLLAARARQTDLVARYGGEEFVVLMPETEPTGAYVMAERFRLAVAEGGGRGSSLTVSVGVATCAGDDVDHTDLIEAADRALYRAKEDGRNRSVAAPVVA